MLRSTVEAASSPEPGGSQIQVYQGPGGLFGETGLTNGQTYHYTLFARDDAGLWSSRRTVRVTPADTTAPGAPSITSPANNSYDRDGAFSVAGTAEPGSRVDAYEGTVHKGTSIAAAGTGAWTIALTDVASGRHAYTATATDAWGNISPGSAPRTVMVDQTKPTVRSISPASRATGVSTTANGFATFSEAMHPSTVTRTTVKLLRRGTRSPVAATVSYDVTRKRATLNPMRALVKGATYTATVTRGARDLAGNPLATTRSWSFTTRR